ncbi:adenosylmethionine--8-amino-7-oxononanoate transaminase [uncultured Desulfobacter sp.]|uniref:adenosylmethionine--8-amino-7-oxononanoate transaminase n=1 Tax=uncultured Desulfobacter sp. TaxID=240139 RepID=UPI0029F5571A|nr:adenosylmethionine--8-amino-7-oxononanoate transaminase [uncultured Desulfobacter sp.]
MNRAETYLAFDKQHIWHPYTSMANPIDAYMVKKAEGVHIHLADGRVLTDGMSSWWAAIHGYNHPVLNRALHEQIQNMSHIMFGGLTHEPACILSEKLISIVPQGLEHIFFSDSGSVAVEVAIKMAIQYQHALGKPGKKKLLTVKKGYHGDTFAAMGVCDPVQGMHCLFKNVLPGAFFAQAPQCSFFDAWDETDTAQIASLMAEHHQEIAAVILEPVVQGAGGMRFYHPNYLKQLRALCNRYDMLLIFDEIATGFGRTGKLFAAQWAEICPDIMCIGKALTGGYISFAATLATSEVARGISAKGGVFMHGPTFMGNPLACAVANAGIDLLMTGAWQTQVAAIQRLLTEHLAPARDLKGVKDVRVLGAIGVIELKEEVDIRVIQDMFVQAGVWIRPFGRLVYTMPPYVCRKEDVVKIAQTMCQVLNNYLKLHQKTSGAI